MEIWKDIKGYEGSYQVSDQGRVKSLERIAWNGFKHHTLKERILKQSKGNYPYFKVVLSKNGKTKTRRVHKLVAFAFLGDCIVDYGRGKNNYQINHIDSDTTNNKASNLEWCSPKQNVNHQFLTNNGTPIKNFKECHDHLGNWFKSKEARCRHYGKSNATVADRLEAGYSLEIALTANRINPNTKKVMY